MSNSPLLYAAHHETMEPEERQRLIAKLESHRSNPGFAAALAKAGVPAPKITTTRPPDNEEEDHNMDTDADGPLRPRAGLLVDSASDRPGPQPSKAKGKRRARDVQAAPSTDTTADPSRESMRQPSSRAGVDASGSMEVSEDTTPRAPAQTRPKPRPRKAAAPPAPIVPSVEAATTPGPATSSELQGVGSALTRSVEDMARRLSALEAVPGQIAGQQQMLSAILKSHEDHEADRKDLSAAVERMTTEMVKMNELYNVLVHMCTQQAEKTQALFDQVAALSEYVMLIGRRVNQPR
ncbi:hypothetical protein PUNSTDRAFT_130384 [Punctularia strigosozonata HHB-11173 SS5]|uniref:uncharacterized protein n=1 Tax=Punctularia strigosozonata (strain HHB-11173) TaxID=741275 RepID=UPI00044179FA|nr:uncharacterized protein PUNSTDRAFT_130384 [Punctularia strigosozonata HHB-11173 SS5]EIN12111.1 hypothetical protein PUNSTDRAFT_130384 [Punctularia strigosozonata HHB-11173 SS5]